MVFSLTPKVFKTMLSEEVSWGPPGEPQCELRHPTQLQPEQCRMLYLQTSWISAKDLI